jgi:hypothetical protein
MNTNNDHYFQNQEPDFKIEKEFSVIELEIIKCLGSHCKLDVDIDIWLRNNEPSIEFFAIDELVNWELPIENKRPIFKNIAAAGHLKIGTKFVTGAIMDL